MRVRLLLLPYLLGLLALVVVPGVATFVLAFADYDLVQPARWIGVGNFGELARDGIFHTALRNSFLFAAFAVPLRLLVALALALLLHRRARFVGAGRTAAVLPSVVPEIAYGLLWLWLFNPLYGPINLLLQVGGKNGLTVLGRTPPPWLTDPTSARTAIVVMGLFTVAETFLVVLAARQLLPNELYELAALEDATAWDVFRRVTLPLLAPVLSVLALRDTILSLQISFIPALVVTDGGPPPFATTYLPLFVYRNAFEYTRYGYAAAATVVVFALTALAVVLQWRLIRRYRDRHPW